MRNPLTVKSLTAVAALALATSLSACATSEAPATESDKAAEKVTITDSRGEKITLDGPAKRVGATEWNAAEYATSLGVAPVAVSDVKGFATWDSAVELPSGTTDLGTRGEPSIDTVASAGLDVLFVTDELAGNALEQIEDQGTPVVVMPGGDAKDPVAAMWANVDLVAKATGTEDEAKKLRTAYDAKVAETRTVVEAGADAPVAFSDGYEVSGQVSIRPYGEGSLLGAVMKDAGLTNAWSDVAGLEFDPAYGLAQTDVEGLTKLPADTRYWYIGNDEDAASNIYDTALKTNKVWTSLPFVEGNQVARVPDKIWMFGGPASMMQFLDAVQDAVRG